MILTLCQYDLTWYNSTLDYWLTCIYTNPVLVCLAIDNSTLDYCIQFYLLTSTLDQLIQLLDPVGQSDISLVGQEAVSESNKVVFSYSNQSHWRTVGPEQEMVVVQVKDVLLPIWEAGGLIYPCRGNIRTIGGREQKNDYKNDLTYALQIWCE